MNTRYGSSHTGYHLGTANSTTSSNSLLPLTHLPSPSCPFQYLPQATQHSSTFQHRHSSVAAAAAYGQVLPSSLQVANSPPIPGTTSYLTGPQRPSTMNYNVGYGNAVSTTAPSYVSQQHMHPPLQSSPILERLPNQAVSPSQEHSAFSSPRISQEQEQWSSPGFQ